MKVLEFKKKKEVPKYSIFEEGVENQNLYPEKIREALSKWGSHQGNVKKYNKKEEV
jgi:hypothetical protein